MSQVDQVVRVDVASLVVLTVAHDGVPTKELLVKEHYHLVVGVSNNSTTKTKWNVLSSGRVNVDNTISHVVIIRGLVRVGLAPEREALLIHKVRREVLIVPTLELDCLELFLDGVLVYIELLNEVRMQSIEAHLNKWQVR